MKSTLYMIAVAALLLAGAPVLAQDFVLVVNKANPVSSLSDQEAKNIFLGKKTNWADGKLIALHTQENAPVHETFVKQIAGKNPQQFAIFWKKALFTGTGTPPIDVKSDAEMKAAVAADPRAIGYVSAGAVDGTVKELKLQ